MIRERPLAFSSHGAGASGVVGIPPMTLYGLLWGALSCSVNDIHF